MPGSTRQLIVPPSLAGSNRASAGQGPPSLAGSNRASARPSAQPPSTYEAYYGLVEPPFSLTPGLRFTYNSRSHATALSQVRQALERREGLIVVTGEVGTGKTMLCRALMQDTHPGTSVSLVLDPCLSAEEILEHVLTDFGVMNEEIGSFGRLAPAVPRHQMLILLQRFLASLIPVRGRAVIVIDEAQHLRPEVLEQIRLWSNFETNDTKLLQIVLAGQSELDDVLRRPEMRQIQQRVSRRCELTPLSKEEVAEYIDHRLWVARGFVLEAGDVSTPAVRFTPRASGAVASISGGIPRIVNVLCDRALEIGCEQQAENVDRVQVELAAGRLGLTAAAVEGPEPEAALVPDSAPALPHVTWPVAGMPRVTRRLAFAAAGLGILLVGAPLAWRTRPVSAEALRADVAVTPAPPAARAGETLQTQAVLKVTVATFASEARAQAVASSLTADGYPAFTRKEPGGSSYRLFVGPYVSADAGEAARRALQAQGVAGTEMSLDNQSAGFSADVRYAKPGPAVSRGSRPAEDPPELVSTPSAAAEVAPQPYDAAVRPAIDRFERLAPFLISAATSPSAPVLKAIEETLATLNQSVATMTVPEESRPAHDLLTSAISVAMRAVTADYPGDRAAQARHAVALLEQAKVQTIRVEREG